MLRLCGLSLPLCHAGEAEGKAGGYGIQGTAGAFIKELRGCYYNVTGFPLHAFTAKLRSLIDQGLL